MHLMMVKSLIMDFKRVGGGGGGAAPHDGEVTDNEGPGSRLKSGYTMASVNPPPPPPI